MNEGQKVAYAGDSDPFNEVGSLGRVVALSGTCAHVQWTSGPKTGQIDLVEQFELVPDRKVVSAQASSFDQALDMVGTTETIQVRATYDEQGEEALVNALSEGGHLATLSPYVEDVVGLLATKVRQDPILGGVLAELEADEVDSLVHRVAAVLLNDRLGEA